MRKAGGLGAYIIGVDADIYNTVLAVSADCNADCSSAGRSKLLTSVLKRVDISVYTVIKNLLEDKFYGGGCLWMDYNLNGVGLAPPHDTGHIWQSYQYEINKIISTLKITGLSASIIDIEDASVPFPEAPTNVWKKFNPLSSSPPSYGGSNGIGFAYHAAATGHTWFLTETFSYGGISINKTTSELTELGEAWSFEPSRDVWTYRSCLGTFQPLFATVDCAIAPSKRAHAKMISLDAGLLLYGGSYTTTVNGASQKVVLSDMWLLIPGRPFYAGGTTEDVWRRVSSGSSSIPAQALEAFVMEALDGDRGIVYGGSNEEGLLNSNLWSVTLDSSGMTASWNAITATSISHPTIRKLAASTMYKSNLYIFGGLSPKGVVLKDCWTFNVFTNQWRQLADIPFPRASATAGIIDFLDSNSITTEVIALAGGFNEGSDATSDIFLYDPSSQCEAWETCNGDVCPRQNRYARSVCGESVSDETDDSPSRFGHSAFFRGSSVVLIGGVDSSKDLSSDMWVYHVGHLGNSSIVDPYDPDLSFNGTTGGYSTLCAFNTPGPGYTVRRFPFITGIVVALIVPNIILGLARLYVNFKYRKSYLLRASSNLFVSMVIVLCMVISLCSVWYTFDVTQETCAIREVISLCTVLGIISTLLSVSLREFHLFAGDLLKIKSAFTNIHVTKRIVVFMLIEAIVLVSMFYSHRFMVFKVVFYSDSTEKLQMLQRHCSYDPLFGAIQGCYFVVLTNLAIYSSWATKG